MSEEVKIGTPVVFKFGDTLIRKGTYTGSGKRVWMKRRDEPGDRYGSMHADVMDKEISGFIIGARTLSNGDYTKGWSRQDYFGEWDGEPDQYQVEETFQAYLVVESIRTSPIKIRVEDVKISW